MLLILLLIFYLVNVSKFVCFVFIISIYFIVWWSASCGVYNSFSDHPYGSFCFFPYLTMY